MTQPIFFKINSGIPQTDTDWINALGATLSSVVTDVAKNGAPKPIKFAIGWVSGTQADYTADEISTLVEPTTDPERIKIGGKLYYVGDIMRLKYLAPEIVTMILNGTQPRTLNVSQLVRQPIPLCWQQQKQLLNIA